LKEPSAHKGQWGSLFKSRITNSVEIVERPQTRKHKATGQALLKTVPFGEFNRAGSKDQRHNEVALVGLSWDEFQGHTAVS
jgi:hypothetical protein